MDASRKLTEARSNYFTALYNYNTAKASLDRYMGVPVTIDVVRYVESEKEGKTASESREDAALTSEAAEVPETGEVAPVVLIDFETSSPLPSEKIEQETKEKDFEQAEILNSEPPQPLPSENVKRETTDKAFEQTKTDNQQQPTN